MIFEKEEEKQKHAIGKRDGKRTQKIIQRIEVFRNVL